MKKIRISKSFAKLLLVLVLCMSFLISLPDSAEAEAVLPGAMLSLDIRQKPVGFVADPNIVTWDMLGLSETQLTGPYDALYFSFSLPADWELTEGAELNLSMGISINNGVQGQSNPTGTDQSQSPSVHTIGAGSLTVYLNDNTLAVLPIDQVGEVNKVVPIPLEAFTSVNDAGVINVAIILDSGLTCNSLEQVYVLIRSSSYFFLPHETIQPSTSLVGFPRPIYQNSFVPDSTLLVIPDQPSTADLQAALTVSAGLSRLSNGDLTVDMTTMNKLTEEQKATNDLIFIGNAASLPVLGQLQLPQPLINGKYDVSGGSPDDGVVEMVISPWNKANVILVVSGNTDQGTIKAAQAVSTGVLRPNKSQDLAIVQDIQAATEAIKQPVDQSLASLGYQGRLFESRGVNYASYSFNIPPGWTVTPDSYFELVFGHSALIDYDNSGIVVLLNGKPIGSVRMSDATAGISANKVLVDIPVAAVAPGKNRLEIRTNLLPHDVCSPKDMRGVWVNIWPESTLHLPLDLALVNPTADLGLDSYPQPFVYYPLLDNTAFVVLHDDLESWQAAVKLSAYLGANTSGPITLLKVYYSDDVPEAERPKYNLFVIGRPDQMAFLNEINNILPVPFKEDGSDIIDNGKFQVTYRISPDSPMGYIETMPSPWNPDNIILTVLGNTKQGLSWATSALIDPKLRSQLAGNFAAINDQQIITTDTRLSQMINSQSTQVAEVVVVPPNVNTNSSQPSGQQAIKWIFPVFIFSIFLIIVISAIVAIGSWSRNRTRSDAGKKRSKTE